MPWAEEIKAESKICKSRKLLSKKAHTTVSIVSGRSGGGFRRPNMHRKAIDESYTRHNALNGRAKSRKQIAESFRARKHTQLFRSYLPDLVADFGVQACIGKPSTRAILGTQCLEQKRLKQKAKDAKVESF
jgi:hypothetical protein